MKMLSFSEISEEEAAALRKWIDDMRRDWPPGSPPISDFAMWISGYRAAKRQMKESTA